MTKATSFVIPRRPAEQHARLPFQPHRRSEAPQGAWPQSRDKDPNSRRHGPTDPGRQNHPFQQTAPKSDGRGPGRCSVQPVFLVLPTWPAAFVREGCRSSSEDFTSAAPWLCFRKSDLKSRVCWISGHRGEGRSEETWDEILQDALHDELRPIYDYLDRKPISTTSPCR